MFMVKMIPLQRLCIWYIWKPKIRHGPYQCAQFYIIALISVHQKFVSELFQPRFYYFHIKTAYGKIQSLNYIVGLCQYPLSPELDSVQR